MLCLATTGALNGKLGKFFTQGIKLLLSESIQNSLPRLSFISYQTEAAQFAVFCRDLFEAGSNLQPE